MRVATGGTLAVVGSGAAGVLVGADVDVDDVLVLFDEDAPGATVGYVDVGPVNAVVAVGCGVLVSKLSN